MHGKSQAFVNGALKVAAEEVDSYQHLLGEWEIVDQPGWKWRVYYVERNDTDHKETVGKRKFPVNCILAWGHLTTNRDFEDEGSEAFTVNVMFDPDYRAENCVASSPDQFNIETRTVSLEGKAFKMITGAAHSPRSRHMGGANDNAADVIDDPETPEYWRPARQPRYLLAQDPTFAEKLDRYGERLLNALLFRERLAGKHYAGLSRTLNRWCDFLNITEGSNSTLMDEAGIVERFGSLFNYGSFYSRADIGKFFAVLFYAVACQQCDK